MPSYIQDNFGNKPITAFSLGENYPHKVQLIANGNTGPPYKHCCLLIFQKVSKDPYSVSYKITPAFCFLIFSFQYMKWRTPLLSLIVSSSSRLFFCFLLLLQFTKLFPWGHLSLPETKTLHGSHPLVISPSDSIASPTAAVSSFSQFGSTKSQRELWFGPPTETVQCKANPESS